MQYFVIFHETSRPDKRHHCDSTLTQVRLVLDSSSYNLSVKNDCWIQPQRRSHLFAVRSPDSQRKVIGSDLKEWRLKQGSQLMLQTTVHINISVTDKETGLMEEFKRSLKHPTSTVWCD